MKYPLVVTICIVTLLGTSMNLGANEFGLGLGLSGGMGFLNGPWTQEQAVQAVLLDQTLAYGPAFTGAFSMGAWFKPTTWLALGLGMGLGSWSTTVIGSGSSVAPRVGTLDFLAAELVGSLELGTVIGPGSLAIGIEAGPGYVLGDLNQRETIIGITLETILSRVQPFMVVGGVRILYRWDFVDFSLGIGGQARWVGGKLPPDLQTTTVVSRFGGLVLVEYSLWSKE